MQKFELSAVSGFQIEHKRQAPLLFTNLKSLYGNVEMQAPVTPAASFTSLRVIQPRDHNYNNL